GTGEYGDEQLVVGEHAARRVGDGRDADDGATSDEDGPVTVGKGLGEPGDASRFHVERRDEQGAAEVPRLGRERGVGHEPMLPRAACWRDVARRCATISPNCGRGVGRSRTGWTFAGTDDGGV